MSSKQKFELLKVSWLESVKIFLPKNFWLFFLVTLKSLKDTYFTLFRIWPILAISAIAIYAVLSFNNQVQDPCITPIINSFILIYIMIMFIGASRPSIEYKNWAYLNKYLKLFLKILILFLVYGLIVSILNRPDKFDILEAISALTPKCLLNKPFAWQFYRLIFFSPFKLIYLTTLLLFLADTQPKVIQYIKAAGRALLMIVFNLPFYIITFFMFMGLTYGLTYIVAKNLTNIDCKYIDLINLNIILLICLPFYICLITNFYTKRIHEQFLIYYRLRE